MLYAIRRLLTPPVFEDEEQTRRAGLLNAVALLTVGGLLAYAILLPLIAPALARRLLIPALMVPVVLGAGWLMRRGQVRLASAVFLLTILIIQTFGAITGGGVHSPAFNSYVIAVVMAVLLLGGRAGVIVSGVISLIGLGLVYAESNGLLISPFHTSLSTWGVELVVFMLSAFLVSLATRATRNALQRTQRELAGRTQAETALRLTELRYRKLFEQSPDSVVVIDPQTMAIVEFNDRACRQLGYSREEFARLAVIDFEAAETPEETREHAQKLLREGYVSFETLHRTKQGEVRNVVVTAQTIDLPDGIQVLSVFHDFTERKRAEDALRESDKQLRTALETSPDAVMAINSEGQIMLANYQMERTFGWRREELLGQKVELLMSEHLRAEHVHDRTMYFSNPGLRRMGTRAKPSALRKDGSEFPVEISLSPLSVGGGLWVLVVVRDISERERIEAALHESEQRFRLLVESVQDYAIFALDSDGFVTSWNEGAERINGYTAQEIVGRHFSCFFLSKDLEDGKPEHELKTALVVGRCVTEGWLMRKNRQRYWANVALTALHDNNGAVYGFVNITRDMTESKQAEEKLRESAAALAAAQQIAHLGSWERDLTIVEGTNQKPQRWSDELFRILGYEPGTIAATTENYLRAIPAEEREAVNAAMAEAMRSGGHYSLDHRIRLPNGVERIVHERSSIFYDQMTGQPLKMTGTVQDITERMQSEAALREQQARQQKILDSMFAFVGLFSPDGIVLETNRAPLQAAGLKAEDVIGKPFADAYWWSHSEATQAQVRETIRRAALGETVRADFLARILGGRLITIDAVFNPLRDFSGRTVQVVGSGVDITDRKQAEAESRLLRDIALGMGGAADFDAAMTLALRQVCETTGWVLGEAWVPSAAGDYLTPSLAWHGTDPAALAFHAESKHFTFAPGVGLPGRVWVSKRPVWIQDVTAASNFPRVQEARRAGIKAGMGVPILAADVVVAVFAFFVLERRDEDERLIALVAAVAAQLGNIVLRKQAEAEILRLNAELEQRVVERTAQLEVANKELEAFSYSVSHDLRAPLRSINGFSEALLDDYADKLDAPGRHSLDRIRANTQRMGHLIDDLLNLAQITRAELRREPVSLSALAQSVAGELREREPDRVVTVAIAEGLEAIGDQRLLLIVLENLMGNAWKFTAKRPDARIEFGAAPQLDGRLAYFVRDNGVGFDMTYAEKLFGAFRRLHTTTEFPGTGIGLATVQRIVHRHGGRIWAEAAEGQGATFYFTL